MAFNAYRPDVRVDPEARTAVVGVTADESASDRASGLSVRSHETGRVSGSLLLQEHFRVGPFRLDVDEGVYQPPDRTRMEWGNAMISSA